MLLYLSQQLLERSAGTTWAEHLSALRLFRYISFRSFGAAVTALALSWWLGVRMIAWLKQLKFGQDYTDKAETGGGLTARLFSKKATPTMGGILIVLALNVTTLLWAQWNTLVQLTLLSVVVLTALGFYDDYAKIVHQSPGGDRSRVKLLVQAALGLFIGLYLWLVPSTSTLIVSFVFVALTYLAGNARAAAYLQIPYVGGAGELTVFCAAMIGAGLGFLWFNCHPAQVFIRD